MIEVTPTLKIEESELRFDYLRSSGPGGQNVNKVSTAVQLRFDVHSSPSLPEEVKQRLARLAGRRMTEDGWLVIEARRYRGQERNREDALRRLTTLLERAEAEPKARRATRPSAAARAARLEGKKKRATLKQERRKPDSWD